MKRYRVVTVDPLNTEGKLVVPGTYTLESARRMVNLHRKLAGDREASIEETEPRKQRYAYYVELTFDSRLVRRQWIREYPPEKAIQQVFRRMGSRLASIQLWWCRDDYELGDPPLLEYRRMGGMFGKVGRVGDWRWFLPGFPGRFCDDTHIGLQATPPPVSGDRLDLVREQRRRRYGMSIDVVICGCSSGRRHNRLTPTHGPTSPRVTAGGEVRVVGGHRTRGCQRASSH